MKAYFNEAHFLMENMTKRNQTVLIVANALVNIQSGYFLYDDELYPCTLITACRVRQDSMNLLFHVL